MKKRIFTLLFPALLIVLTLAALAPSASARETLAYVEVDGSAWLLQEGGTALPNDDGIARFSLSDDAARQAILAGLRAHKETIDLARYEIRRDEIGALYFGTVNDYPELFFVGSRYRYGYNGETITAVYPEYKYDASTAERMLGAYRAKVREITAGVDESWSDFEIALYFNDYLATHAKYDLNKAEERYDAYSLLVGGKGVCQAYTLAYRELLNQFDIPNGTAQSDAMNHIWNLVMIGGEWYHVDVTWNDPTNNAMSEGAKAGDYSVPDAIGQVQHDHFLLSDAGIRAKEHFDWVASPNVPCTSTRYDSWELRGVTSAIVPLKGSWYCIKGGGYGAGLYSAENVQSGPWTLCENLASFRWPVWNQPYSYWNGVFSALAVHRGDLIYHDARTIYRYDASTGTQRVLLAPDTAQGFLYGLTVEGSELTYLLAQDPQNHAWSLHRETIDSFVDTGRGFSWFREGDVLHLRVERQGCTAAAAYYDARGRQLGLRLLTGKGAAAEIVLPRGAEKTVVYVLDEQFCPQAEPTQLR